jgi:hypothetical protein
LSNSFLKKQEELYNVATRSHKFKNSKMYNPLRLDTGLNSLALFSKEGFLNAPLVSKKNYLILHNESLIDSLDDSYESFKNFSLATSRFSKSLALNNDYFIHPHSYTRVLDPFRADYEEVL